MKKLIVMLAFYIVWGQGLAQNQPAVVTNIIDKDSSYLWVHEKQSFQGNLTKFLHDNIQYPLLAKKKRVEGRVYIQFIIEQNGSVSNVKTVKGIGSGCNQEAERLIGLTSGKWSPGKYDGKPVRVKIIQPIIFTLTPRKK